MPRYAPVCYKVCWSTPFFQWSLCIIQMLQL